MADEKRQIILDLLARDKSGQATDSFARNLDKLGHTAEDTKRQIGNLDKEISVHQENLKGLAKAYSETDDKATRLDLSKAIRGAEAEVKKLSKSKGILQAMMPDEQDTRGFASKLGSDLVSGLKSVLPSVGGPLVPVLGGMAVAAAPILGATIAGAIIGGAGIGGVVGGAILAASDPRVMNAFIDLGALVQDTLTNKATAAFADPLVKAADTMKADFVAIGPDISRIFSDSAQFVAPLTDGLSHFLSSVVHGLADLTDHAGPVIQVISDGVAGIGDAIGGMFTDLSDNGVDAAEALTMAFNGVITVIKGTGAVINGLTEAFGFLASIGAFGRDAAVQYALIKEGAERAAAATKEAADQTAGMTDVSKANIAVIHGEVNALSDLADALKAETDPAFGFLNAQTKMTKAHEAATKALKQHGLASPEYQEAVRKEAGAALALEDAAGKVAATSNGRMTPALKATLQAAGMTAPEIAEVGRQLDAAHKKGDAFAKTYKAHATLQDSATQQLNSLRQTMANIDGSTIHVYANVSQTGIQNLGGHAISGRAVGGPVARARPYIVGEAGPELFMPEMNGTIMTAEATRRLMAGGTRPGAAAAGGGGGGVAVLDVRGADSDLIRLIRKWINNGELSFG